MNEGMRPNEERDRDFLGDDAEQTERQRRQHAPARDTEKASGQKRQQAEQMLAATP
jgi:hypothetical protein